MKLSERTICICTIYTTGLINGYLTKTVLCLITRNPETGVLVVGNGDTCNNNFQINLCVWRGEGSIWGGV